MGDIIQKLNYLDETKSLIKLALSEKGSAVTDIFRDYPDLINRLPSKATSIDFADMGYDDTDPTFTNLKSKIDHSIEIYNSWEPFNWEDPSTGKNKNFLYDTNLVIFPKIDTSHMLSMQSMFAECTSLQTIPQLDTSNVTDMLWMFWKCTSLKSVPQLDTSNVTDMTCMFEGCTSLKSVPQFDTSKVVSMAGMFRDCKNLTGEYTIDMSSSNYGDEYVHQNDVFKGSGFTKVNVLNSGKVIAMSHMFENSSIQEVSDIDFSSCRWADGMFVGCKNLISIPNFKFPLNDLYDPVNNPQQFTSTTGMFKDCLNLIYIPPLSLTTGAFVFENCGFCECGELKTDLVTDVDNMFNIDDLNGTEYIYNFMILHVKFNGFSLKSAERGLDTMFGKDKLILALTQYLLIKDIGTPQSVTYYDFSGFSSWGVTDSIPAMPGFGIPRAIDNTGADKTVVDTLLTYSFDRKAAGYENCTIALHPNIQSRLTEDQITAIQNKGYTLAF